MKGPRLMRSGLTGRIYTVTRYKELGGGRFEAITKHEVPEADLMACGLYRGPQPVEVTP